jgi:hypothetical protein
MHYNSTTREITYSDQALIANNLYANSGIAIGSTSMFSTYQLFLSGDRAGKLTTTTWNTYSDERIKEDIVNADLYQCYSTIDCLNLKYFKWNSNFVSPDLYSDSHNLGFIAQEVKQYFPKSVDIVSNSIASDFHILNTDQIYKAHLGATKQLIAMVKAQQAELNELRSTVQALVASR